jgi:hypothetical protein
MERKIIDLEIIEDLEQSGVDAIALVDEPAIGKYWMYFKSEDFVEPRSGEQESDFISRCVPVLMDEGKTQDQALGACYGMWKQKFGIDTSSLPPYVHQTDEEIIEKDPKMEFSDELDVFGYRTKHFFMCPAATAQFKQLIADSAQEDDYGMVRAAARAADGIFAIEHNAINNDFASTADLKEAMVLLEDFNDVMAEISKRTGKSYDTAYMTQHIEKIHSYLNKGLPEVNGDKVNMAAVEDLKVGDPVSWKVGTAEDQNPRGRIREIVRDGSRRVPGVDFKIEGTPDNPGYIIEIYERKDGDWAPTKKYVGRKAGSLIKNIEFKTWRGMFADEHEKVIVAPVAIPNIEIIRKGEDGEPYWVRFSKETIQRMAEKFMKELRNKDTNIQHVDDLDAGSYVFESWIVEDAATDKANTKYGLEVPEGSWVTKMRVENENTWNKVKTGELRGLSLQGNFVERSEYEAYKEDKQKIEDLVRILNEI